MSTRRSKSRWGSWALVTMLAQLPCGGNVDQVWDLRGDLRQALEAFRPSVARLTVASTHVECTWPVDSSAPASAASSNRGRACSSDPAPLSLPLCSAAIEPGSPLLESLSSISSRLRKLALQGPTPEIYHLQALLTILLGDEAEDVEEAVDILTRARLDRPEDAEILSDLAAAYFQLAGLTHRPELLLEAYRSADEALRYEPDLEAALFNRALVLSYLSLRLPARRAWAAYHARDSTSGWAQEGRQLLAQESKVADDENWKRTVDEIRRAARGSRQEVIVQLVAGHRERAREWAERNLLSRWSNSESGSPESNENLRLASAVGDALVRLAGDRMLADGVAAIETADPETLRRLSRGHRNLALGYERLYDDWDLSAAHREFESALAHLDGHSPYAMWAEFYLALVSYYQERYREASEGLTSLATRVDPSAYPALLGRSLWIDGLVAIATQNLQRSAEKYGEALELFCWAGEEENRVTIQALLAESLSKLGQFRESWRHEYEALRGIGEVFNPIRHHAVLESAILNAGREGRVREVLPFAHEHVAVAEKIGSPQIINFAHRHRAALYLSLEMRSAAKVDLERAARAAEQLEDPALKRRTQASYDLTVAELLVDEDPQRAEAQISRTIETYLGTEYTYLLPDAYGARSRARLRAGNLDGAQEDLAAQIALYERSASLLFQDRFRISYATRTAGGYEEMVGFQALLRGRPWLAFGYSERGRARALLSSFEAGALKFHLPDEAVPSIPSPISAEAAQRDLEPTIALLEYAVLEDRLLVWLVRSDNRDFKMIPIEQDELSRWIDAFRREILHPRHEPSRRAAARLFDVFVKPIESKLIGARQLIVIPDKSVFAVPFEALWDTDRGRFLIEDYNVEYAPSSAVYFRLRERSRRSRWLQHPSVLAISGSRRGEGVRFPALREAELEARNIASMYVNGAFLDATAEEKRRVLDRIDRAEILHFAGHAVLRPDEPLASRLILADSPSRFEDLYAYELYGQRFENLHLVVLSACSTAAMEAVVPSEGVSALARPFLASGVPGVIGSQWPVDDAPTRRFFEEFHHHLAAGMGPSNALRATKIRFLESSEPELKTPATWAAFVLTGGLGNENAIDIDNDTAAKPLFESVQCARRAMPLPGRNNRRTG